MRLINNFYFRWKLLSYNYYSINKVFVHAPLDTIFIKQNIPEEKIKIIKPDNWELFMGKISYLVLAIIAIFLAGLFFKKK